MNESASSIDSNIFVDTLLNTSVTPAEDKEDNLTLSGIRKLLQENNKSLISELKSIIQNEIQDVLAELKIEIKQSIETNKHAEFQEEIQLLNKKIQKLNYQCLSLTTETKSLQSEIERKQYQNIATAGTETMKTFVLHGLIENQWETEEETHDRVIYAIQDILNIDLTGYIEDISHIGTKSLRRPVRIELISKRLTNYILKNASYFKNTGLAVSKLLDEQSLRERHLLRAALLSARRNGKHAMIHNNTLVIDGKKINIYELQPTQKNNKIQSHQNHVQKQSSNEQLQQLDQSQFESNFRDF